MLHFLSELLVFCALHTAIHRGNLLFAAYSNLHEVNVVID